jgi:hypothetical protein
MGSGCHSHIDLKTIIVIKCNGRRLLNRFYTFFLLDENLNLEKLYQYWTIYGWMSQEKPKLNALLETTYLLRCKCCVLQVAQHCKLSLQKAISTFSWTLPRGVCMSFTRFPIYRLSERLFIRKQTPSNH